MLKIFSTQLLGCFKKLAENEEITLEDSARVLAQAIVGDGHIYVYGANEMHAITLEATLGQEPLPKAKKLQTIEEISSMDRVLLVSRYSTDEEILSLAKKLQSKGIQTVGISTRKEGEASLENFVDVHIDTQLVRGLIPTDDGSRIGFPTSMIALFAYYGLSFTIQEIIEEYM
jgi:fructoselysine-6-P-deglycase FrlB-like protein